MSMSDGSFAPTFLPVSAMLIAGIMFGVGSFRMLRWTAELYGARHVAAPAALTLARFLGAALFLGFAARLGASAVLAAFLGFFLARALAIRAVRRAS